jgi:hypothetical protein
LENIINIYDTIESSINSLINNGLTPSTILMPIAVLKKFLKTNIDSKYKFYMKFTTKNFKFNESTNLEIVKVPQEIENNIIIILDKNSCIWTFKSIEDKNERVYIKINENNTETDILQVDVTVKTIANLEVVNQNAIKVLMI